MQESQVKIAIVHDWLVAVGGAEMVLKSLHELYPQAPIYTLFNDPDFSHKFIPKAKIITSELQRLSRLGGFRKMLAPLLPVAIEGFDLSEYDVVISSSTAYAKGVVTRPGTIHINYCYSPTRQLWDWHAEYITDLGILKKTSTRLMQHLMRLWDRPAADRAEHLIAISKHVKQRIEKYYRRHAEIIYPPINIPQLLPPGGNDGYYLLVSRLYAHKNVHLAIKAFNKLGYNLRVIGEGPEFKKLSRIAENNIRLMGTVTNDELWRQYASCKAFIMPQEEDFGIAPLEAMACGKPVLALARGGALEYVIPGSTGELFEDPVFECLADGVRRLNENYAEYNSEFIKATAQKYNTLIFKNNFKILVDSVINKHYGLR